MMQAAVLAHNSILSNEVENQFNILKQQLQEEFWKRSHELEKQFMVQQQQISELNPFIGVPRQPSTTALRGPTMRGQTDQIFP